MVAPVRRLVTANEPSSLALIMIQLDDASLRFAMRASAKFSAPFASDLCNCHVSVPVSDRSVFNVSAAPPLMAPLFRIATRGLSAPNRLDPPRRRRRDAQRSTHRLDQCDPKDTRGGREARRSSRRRQGTGTCRTAAGTQRARVFGRLLCRHARRRAARVRARLRSSERRTRVAPAELTIVRSAPESGSRSPGLRREVSSFRAHGGVCPVHRQRPHHPLRVVIHASVIDEGADRDQLRQLGHAADVVAVIVRDQQVVDPRHAGELRDLEDALRIARWRGRRAGNRRCRCPESRRRPAASPRRERQSA